MAINKTSKNMTITVFRDYNLIVGNVLEKKASKLNMETNRGNIVLISNKKIVSVGNKS